MAGMLRVVTWNLQGSAGLDVDAAAGVLQEVAPDIAVLQEVQRSQCIRLAAACRMSGRRWAFKHWPIVSRPEGLAVLSCSPLSAAAAFVLRASWPWSWRRRVAIDATAVVERRPIRIVNVHLSPHDETDGRGDEIDRVIARRGVVAPILAGDFNERPGAAPLRRLVEAGWTDAWALHQAAGGAAGSDGRADRPDAGATNWTANAAAGQPPTQRLDMIFVPDRWRVLSCWVVDEPLDRLARLSDHLPVVADLELRS
jgi:endonuclease/exonuclease/phosphatase family metal-dependent hydrolase